MGKRQGTQVNKQTHQTFPGEDIRDVTAYFILPEDLIINITLIFLPQSLGDCESSCEMQITVHRGFRVGTL